MLGTISFLHTKIHSLLPYCAAVVFFGVFCRWFVVVVVYFVSDLELH